MSYFNEKKVGDSKWIAGDEEHEAALAESGVSVEAACRIPARPVSWLVENIIPDETVTVIAGVPGAGKTFFACQLAADAARVSQYRVVLAASGYESPEVLRWRLDQADGDARRVALATLTPNGFKDRRGKPAEESIDERMSILYHTLLGAGDPASGILPAQINVPDDSFPKPRAARLLVIDDVDGWFGKPGNLLPAAALARVIQRLNGLARELRVAIVVLVRTQLSVEGRITTRQLSRLSQAASVVWMLVRDREGSGFRVQGSADGTGNSNQRKPEGTDNPKSYSQSVRRWFLPVKNNLAPDVATYGRAFEIVDGQIRWHADDPAPSLADALLPSAHNTDRRRERRAAVAWLKEALADGPMPSGELYRQGIECGFSKGTLVRAAGELGIHSHKTGFNGGWEMRWVEQPAVRGRGTQARAAGSGYKVYGGEGKAEGKRQKAELVVDGDSSCASSLEREGSCAVSCASSTKREESCIASCASSPSPSSAQCEGMQGEHHATQRVPADGCPGAPGLEGGASCASSAKCEESCGASCASSSSPIQTPTVGPEPPAPESDERLNVYAVVVDALQEACIKEAC